MTVNSDFVSTLGIRRASPAASSFMINMRTWGLTDEQLKRFVSNLLYGNTVTPLAQSHRRLSSARVQLLLAFLSSSTPDQVFQVAVEDPVGLEMELKAFLEETSDLGIISRERISRKPRAERQSSKRQSRLSLSAQAEPTRASTTVEQKTAAKVPTPV